MLINRTAKAVCVNWIFRLYNDRANYPNFVVLIGPGHMNKPLAGKNAIITGAAMGIGKAIATAYIRAGCRVALLDRTEKDLRATADALRAEGGTVYTYVVDLKDADATTRAVQEAIAALGTLQGLV